MFFRWTEERATWGRMKDEGPGAETIGNVPGRCLRSVSQYSCWIWGKSPQCVCVCFPTERRGCSKTRRCFPSVCVVTSYPFNPLHTLCVVKVWCPGRVLARPTRPRTYLLYGVEPLTVSPAVMRCVCASCVFWGNTGRNFTRASGGKLQACRNTYGNKTYFWLHCVNSKISVVQTDSLNSDVSVLL